MTDIIITLPAKVSWDLYQQELDMVADGVGVMRFKVPFLPKQKPERCYLVWRGNVVGWMKVVGVFDGNFSCEVTGNVWIGKFIERSGLFHRLENPIPMRGFQGFRYADRSKFQ